jgi:hypothetical protein
VSSSCTGLPLVCLLIFYDIGKFRVDELESIDWNDESYENLILPEKEKELAWAFVKNKALADSTKFEDFVKDKGLSP